MDINRRLINELVSQHFTQFMFEQGFKKLDDMSYKLIFKGGSYAFVVGITGDYYPITFLMNFSNRISIDYIAKVCNQAMNLPSKSFPKVNVLLVSTRKYYSLPPMHDYDVRTLQGLEETISEILVLMKKNGFQFYAKYSKLDAIDTEIQKGDVLSDKDMDFFIMGDEINQAVIALIIGKICRPQDFESDVDKYRERLKDYDFHKYRFDNAIEYLSKADLVMPQINPPKFT